MSSVLPYQHAIYLEQRGTSLWMKIVFLSLALPYLAAIAFAFRQIVSSPLRPEAMAQCAGVFLIGSVAIFLLGNRAVLQVDSDGLSLRQYLCRFRWFQKTIRISEIEDIAEFHKCDASAYVSDGLSASPNILSRSPSLTRFNWFGRGVRFHVGSHRYLIGSRNPQALIHAIQSTQL